MSTNRFPCRVSTFGCNLLFCAVLLQMALAADDAKPAPAERPYGIAQRIPWTISRLTGSLEPPAPYTVERSFPKLTFSNPVDLAPVPGRGRLALLQQGGKLLTFRPDADVAETDVAVDLSKIGKEFAQAYGLVFHPQFAQNRYCYLAYVLHGKVPEGSRVSRFEVSQTDPPTIDLASEKIIITWMSGGHNGCALQFGNDGCLYISTGDGGDSFPPDGRNTGQDITDLLGSILRIDVDHPAPNANYSIPADNPFASASGAQQTTDATPSPDSAPRGEIWAYGLRNPWRMSVDPLTGHLWVGDVGWEQWEMIYRVERGGNYGWSIVEGTQPVHRERKPGPTPIIEPTIEHSHTEARSITGGYVYRGKRLTDLAGSYVYGDYVTGKIWGLRYDGTRVTEVRELVDTTLQIACFGVDAEGELYIVDYLGGLYRLLPNPRQQANAEFPKTLSATGLFASVRDLQPAPGVIPYSIVAEPWADHATARRFVGLPGSAQLTVHKSEDVYVGNIKGAWGFPNDSVLAKTLSLDMQAGNPATRRNIETQILHRDGDTWRAYTYLWNEAQTDAELVGPEGLDVPLVVADQAYPGGRREQTWHVASRSECIVCHTARAGSTHAFNRSQLNRDHDYGGVSDNQLRTLAHIGLFAEPVAPNIPPLANPYDASADLTARVRAYLHVNCAHCHRRGGGGSAAMDVRHEFTLPQTNLLAARPTQGTFGIPGATVLAPGDPYRSILYYRLSKLGRGHMPQFGSNLIDLAGVRLMHDWISQLPPSDADAQQAATAGLRASEDRSLAEIARTAGQGAAWQAPADALLSTTRGGMRLLDAIDRTDWPAELKTTLARRGAAQTDPQVRDLFERFLPANERVQRLGTAVRADQLLALAGEAERGRQLFATSAGVQCRTCHRIGPVGTELGPDLSKIGQKNSRKQLLESILEPSKVIAPQFVTQLVETTAGKVFTGLLVSRSADEVILKDAQNKTQRIPAGEIELVAPQATSLMPELLLKEMTAQEVADLLEYLSQLK